MGAGNIVLFLLSMKKIATKIIKLNALRGGTSLTFLLVAITWIPLSWTGLAFGADDGGLGDDQGDPTQKIKCIRIVQKSREGPGSPDPTHGDHYVPPFEEIGALEQATAELKGGIARRSRINIFKLFHLWRGAGSLTHGDRVRQILEKTDPYAMKALSDLREAPNRAMAPKYLSILTQYLLERRLYRRGSENPSGKLSGMSKDLGSLSYPQLFVELLDLFMKQLDARGFDAELSHNPLVGHLIYFALGLGREFVELDFGEFRDNFLAAKIERLESRAKDLVLVRAPKELVRESLVNFKARVLFGTLWWEAQQRLDKLTRSWREAIRQNKSGLDLAIQSLIEQNPQDQISLRIYERSNEESLLLLEINYLTVRIFLPHDTKFSDFMPVLVEWHQQKDPFLETAMVQFWNLLLDFGDVKANDLSLENQDQVKQLARQGLLPPGIIDSFSD